VDQYVIAAASAGLAVWLLIPAPSGSGLGRWPFVLAGVAVVGLTVPSRWWVALTLAAVVVVAVLRRVRAGRRRAVTARRAVDIASGCDQLAAELSAGAPPALALDHLADEWPLWQPVVEAARLGADVPGALRTLACEPGSGDLRLLAAAWQVAERTGQSLAAAAESIVIEIAARTRSRETVGAELASVRATARLMIVLPFCSLAMSAGLGGDPWGFLLTTPVGWVCLGAGVGLAWVGTAWVDGLAAAVER
jgi:tight adherence protein B